MAQAARLNLRMQKELKLLLTDPPPGSSFPLLSADLDSSPNSLSTIDAQIAGPEGTVYADGVFHVKIQIPERYPFQPPSVTFSTPIYHPNIDNGGRICLDILNLPPKGAWQPSLNISTVLTSIGLLLSEPNPDDGLMCDASREYKYNRQAFDQKARSMTEKYAKAGARRNSSGSQSIQTNSNTSMQMELKTASGDSRLVNECVAGGICGSRWNLLQNSSGSAQERDANGEVNEGPNDRSSLLNYKNRMEIEGAKKGSKGKEEYQQGQEKEHHTWRKLSLETFGRFQNREGSDNQNLVPNCCVLPNPQEPIVASPGSSSLPKAGNHYDHQEQYEKSIDKGINMRSAKKLTVGNKQLPGSSNTCQITDIMTSSNSKSHANASHGALPVPTAVKCIENPHNSFVDEMENGYSDRNCKTFCSAGKKLPLKFRGPTQTQEMGNKENVVPVQKTSLLHPTGPSMCSSTPSMLSKVGDGYDRESGIGSLCGSHKKCMIGRKLSLGSLSQTQGSHDDNLQMLSHSNKHSEDPHMNRHMQEHCKCDDKQKLDCDHGMDIHEQIKRQKTDESPISESVIVLDSEDSEDEGRVSFRSKSLLARKRIGKWKAKA
ncbi:hypothetical protein I3843_04G153100 [Carya illinoinensis]|nr:hypothetical protein I3843_04G153100 [Carya illinoinensis]